MGMCPSKWGLNMASSLECFTMLRLDVSIKLKWFTCLHGFIWMFCMVLPFKTGIFHMFQLIRVMLGCCHSKRYD